MRISTLLLNQMGVNSILDQQSSLAQIQNKLATGKKILSPADDPSGSAQIIRLAQATTLTDQYQRNSDQAVNRLTLEEVALSNVENSLQRIRELAVQANNSTLDAANRQAIGQEVRQRLDEIYGTANSRDSNGEYLFAGNQVSQRPFSRQADGTFTYNADQGQRLIQISPERRVADSDPGYRVFMDIVSGNGDFQVTDNQSNTGSGIIDLGNVTDSTAYVADTYTITLVTNGNGKLGYNIVGAATGQVIPSPPQDPVVDAPDFSSGASITFNGIETKITGTPAAGDTYTISPGGKRDIFTMVDDLATALESGTTGNQNSARVINTITASLQNLDNALQHVVEYRANVGARLNTIDDQRSVNDAFKIELQTTASKIQDLDIVSAISELQARSYALQAAQSSFTKIQGLSVFNFL